MAFFISLAELQAVIRSLDMHAEAMVSVAEQQVAIAMEALERLIQQLELLRIEMAVVDAEAIVRIAEQLELLRIAMVVLKQRQSGERECLQAEVEQFMEALEQLIQQLQIAMAVLEQRQSGERERLQAEVEQLQAEMERISEQSTFSGIQILDGSLQNATFQIGSEANSSVVISISNPHTLAIGSNGLYTSNFQDIQGTTHRQSLGGGFSVGAAGLGAEVGVGLSSGSHCSGYVAETLTVSHYEPTGTVSIQTAEIIAGQDAKAIATTLSSLNGVFASAFNKVTISHAAGADFNVELTIYGAGGAETANLSVIMNRSGALNFATIATTINSSPAMQALNVYAVNIDGISLDIYAIDGHNISLKVTGAGSFDAASAFNGSHSKRVTSGASYTSAGRVDVTLNAGYSIASNIVGGIFGSTAAGIDLPTTNRLGMLDGSLQNTPFQIGSEAAQAPIELGALPGPILITFHSTAVRRPPIEGPLAIAAPSTQAQPQQPAAQSKP